MTERTAFVLNVRPDKVDEYVRAHAEVWPEMLAALREAGYRNYTIFRHGNQMFGYVESDDPQGAAEFMERQPVNGRWQDAMGALLEERVPDAGPAALEEVFRLD
jgi:L-rhamnose mutarotase